MSDDEDFFATLITDEPYPVPAAPPSELPGGSSADGSKDSQRSPPEKGLKPDAGNVSHTSPVDPPQLGDDPGNIGFFDNNSAKVLHTNIEDMTVPTIEGISNSNERVDDKGKGAEVDFKQHTEEIITIPPTSLGESPRNFDNNDEKLNNQGENGTELSNDNSNIPQNQIPTMDIPMMGFMDIPMDFIPGVQQSENVLTASTVLPPPQVSMEQNQNQKEQGQHTMNSVASEHDVGISGTFRNQSGVDISYGIPPSTEPLDMQVMIPPVGIPGMEEPFTAPINDGKNIIDVHLPQQNMGANMDVLFVPDTEFEQVLGTIRECSLRAKTPLLKLLCNSLDFRMSCLISGPDPEKIAVQQLLNNLTEFKRIINNNEDPVVEDSLAKYQGEPIKMSEMTSGNLYQTCNLLIEKGHFVLGLLLSNGLNDLERASITTSVLNKINDNRLKIFAQTANNNVNIPLLDSGVISGDNIYSWVDTVIMLLKVYSISCCREKIAEIGCQLSKKGTPEYIIASHICFVIAGVTPEIDTEFAYLGLDNPIADPRVKYICEGDKMNCLELTRVLGYIQGLEHAVGLASESILSKENGLLDAYSLKRFEFYQKQGKYIPHLIPFNVLEGGQKYLLEGLSDLGMLINRSEKLNEGNDRTPFSFRVQSVLPAGSPPSDAIKSPFSCPRNELLLRELGVTGVRRQDPSAKPPNVDIIKKNAMLICGATLGSAVNIVIDSLQPGNKQPSGAQKQNMTDNSTINQQSQQKSTAHNVMDNIGKVSKKTIATIFGHEEKSQQQKVNQITNSRYSLNSGTATPVSNVPSNTSSLMGSRVASMSNLGGISESVGVNIPNTMKQYSNTVSPLSAQNAQIPPLTISQTQGISSPSSMKSAQSSIQTTATAKGEKEKHGKKKFFSSIFSKKKEEPHVFPVANQAPPPPPPSASMAPPMTSNDPAADITSLMSSSATMYVNPFST